MILVFGDETKRFDRAMARWVSERANIPHPFRDGEYSAIAVVDEVGETIAAVAIYHDFYRMGTGAKIEMSMAAENPRWAQKGIIRALLHYPFFQLECHVVICTTGRGNRRTRRFLQGIGFVERGMVPNRPFADDTMIYALRREDAEARWFKPTTQKQPESKEAA